MSSDLPSIPSSVVAIIRECADKYNVSARDIIGQTRLRNVCFARFEAIWRVYREVVVNKTSPSLPQIGRWFNRDHTTVLNAIRRHAELMGERPATARYVVQIAPHRFQLMQDLAEAA